jgi:hypothetical protein
MTPTDGLQPVNTRSGPPPARGPLRPASRRRASSGLLNSPRAIGSFTHRSLASPHRYGRRETAPWGKPGSRFTACRFAGAGTVADRDLPGGGLPKRVRGAQRPLPPEPEGCCTRRRPANAVRHLNDPRREVVRPIDRTATPNRYGGRRRRNRMRTGPQTGRSARRPDRSDLAGDARPADRHGRVPGASVEEWTNDFTQVKPSPVRTEGGRGNSRRERHRRSRRAARRPASGASICRAFAASGPRGCGRADGRRPSTGN